MARQRIMGLPIGPKRTSPFDVVKKAGGTAALLVAPALAAPLARKIGDLTRGAGRAVEKGQRVAGQVSGAVETATDVKEAISSHSSTIGKVGGVVKALAGKGGSGGGGSKPKLSHLIEQHTDIAVPRSVVYNQWTQLEMFPTLTKGIESVDQEDDERSRWTSKIGPSRRSWTGRVVEQIPDERIAWRSEGGAQVNGVVTFHSLDEDLTRVLLEMEYKPTGPVEWVGNTLRIQRRRAKRDLRLFKHFLEMHGEETGSWRGRIDRDQPLEPQYSGQTAAGSGGGKQGERDGSSSNGAGPRQEKRGEDQEHQKSGGDQEGDKEGDPAESQPAAGGQPAAEASS
ncbi:MAG TPA: SRPBCC family protein [Acidimicrobiales bacterium]|nr:SRPBCC family protein [Acidimicrobiales bacterium]